MGQKIVFQLSLFSMNRLCRLKKLFKTNSNQKRKQLNIKSQKIYSRISNLKSKVIKTQSQRYQRMKFRMR